MSFSFTISGSPRDAIAQCGREAANQPGVPQEFADAINNQLSGLPENASVSGTVYGHTGWTDGQTGGEISLHATLNVSVPSDS